MPAVSDQDLIREYVHHTSEAAFAELVHRHVDLVYSVAVRVLRNTGLAQDVTQRVFVALARRAHALQDRVVLAGWLHETARNFAVTTVRSEERRRRREQEAAAMETHASTDSGAAADDLLLHLDAALAELDTADRDAILLRYFERRTALEIGERLGLTAEAAQKRTVRALDRLRGILAGRGLTTSASALASLLAAQAVQSAPLGLTASVIALAGTAGAVAPVTSTLQFLMASTKLKLGLAAAFVASVSTPLVIQHQTAAGLRRENEVLRQENAALERFREEQEQRIASATDPQEAAHRRSEQAELLRLRAEVTSLRAQLPGPNKAHDEAVAARAERVPGRWSETPFVAATEWSNVGFGSPIEAYQTSSWAQANRNTNVIAAGLAWGDEVVRSRVEAVFNAAPELVRAHYGSLDAFILSLFNVSTPDASRQRVGHRVLNENISPDSATLMVEEQSGDGTRFPA